MPEQLSSCVNRYHDHTRLRHTSRAFPLRLKTLVDVLFSKSVSIYGLRDERGIQHRVGYLDRGQGIPSDALKGIFE